MPQYKSGNSLTKQNRERLTSISNKLLAEEKNELLFINMLAEREGTAMLHVFLMYEFRAQTKKMLETLENY